MEDTTVPPAAGSMAQTLRKLSRKGGKRLRGGTGVAAGRPHRTKPRPVASLLTLLGDGSPDARGIVCSPAWAELAQQAMAAGAPPWPGAGIVRPCVKFSAVWRALYLARVYPPRDPGRPGGMRTCVLCGRDCPASAVQSDYCVDCQQDRNAREDGSGRNAEELVNDPKDVRRLTQFIPRVGVFEWGDGFGDARLKAESDAELRKEIRRFQKGQWRPEPWRARRKREGAG